MAESRTHHGLLYIADFVQSGVFPNDRRSTLLHEFIHWQDAQEYQRLHGKISSNNDVDSYIDWIRAKSKDIIEKLIEDDYNIKEISPYALLCYTTPEKRTGQFRFDEVYTEYRTKHFLERGQ